MFYKGRHARKKPHQNPRWLNRLLIFAVAVVLLCVLVYPWAEPYMLECDRKDLKSSHLPGGINVSDSKYDTSKLRIVYLTDIHWDSFFPKDYCRKVVRMVNSMNADLVLLGGDYGSSTESAVEFFSRMPKFRARYGVFGVLGDKDVTNLDEVHTLLSAMRSSGVTPLCDETQSVRIGDGYVHVAGLSPEEVTPEKMQKIAGKFAQQDYVILLSHYPTCIPVAISAISLDKKINWFDLGLFGHTHGGQMALLTKQLGLEKYENRYKSGWSQENRIDLLQSNGVGTVGARIRLFCRPQIHIITVSQQ